MGQKPAQVICPIKHNLMFFRCQKCPSCLPKPSWRNPAPLCNPRPSLSQRPAASPSSHSACAMARFRNVSNSTASVILPLLNSFQAQKYFIPLWIFIFVYLNFFLSFFICFWVCIGLIVFLISESKNRERRRFSWSQLWRRSRSSSSNPMWTQ